MCTSCGQHGGSRSFSWHGSSPRSLAPASASSSASSHSSKTCRRGELLTRSVGVAPRMICWPVQDVPRLHPGCHLGRAPASRDPLERCSNGACQHSQAEAENSLITSSSACFSYYCWAVDNFEHKKKKKKNTMIDHHPLVKRFSGVGGSKVVLFCCGMCFSLSAIV